MTTSAKSSADRYDLNVTADVPDFALLFLPPFPLPDTAVAPPVSYGLWKQSGIFIQPNENEGRGTVSRNLSFESLAGHDAALRPLVDMAQNHSVEAKTARQNERLNRRLAEGGELVRMRVEDCLKIGEENTDWVEPEGTANEGRFETTVAPFDRLIAATRDFQYSRNEEFQYHRSRRLFNIMRDSFGLRTERRGAHWPAGEATAELLPENETSCLLRDTNDSVRGFLALARREAESGWDVEPSIKLCQIVAAFLSYVDHHQVFPEQPYASRFAAAAAIARTGPRLLLEALRVEDTLARSEGWNAATWSLWGGQYGGADRGSIQTEEWPVESGLVQNSDSGETGDGGWSADADEFGHPATKSGNARRQQNVNEPNMRARLESLKLNDMRLLQYIPYARRRVVEVLPSAADDGKAGHFSDLCCLVTVPSPWVKAEGWRRMPLGNNDQPSDEAAYDMEDVSPLECEVATIEDPDRINAWVERSVFGNNSSGQSLIGIALRGRWGLFGSSKDAEAQWWAFRSKHYVLPALWSGEEAQDRGPAKDV